MYVSGAICAQKPSSVLHLYRLEHRDQLSFKDFFLPFGGQLSGDNRWIKLAELIPWDELEGDYAAQFCKGFGAPAKPFRMALGTLIIMPAWGSRMKNSLSRSMTIPISSSSLDWSAISIQRHLTHR